MMYGITVIFFFAMATINVLNDMTDKGIYWLLFIIAYTLFSNRLDKITKEQIKETSND